MGTAKGAQLEGATPHPRAVPGTGSTPPLPPSHPVSHAHLLPMEPQMGWPPLPEPVTEPQRGHQSREELQFPEATLSPSWAPPSQLFAWGEWRPGEQETHPRPYREWGLWPPLHLHQEKRSQIPHLSQIEYVGAVPGLDQVQQQVVLTACHSAVTM